MKPKHIFLVRHGESVGNVDRIVYATIPDHKITLTEKGRDQARQAGRNIEHLLDLWGMLGAPLRAVCSTHQRTEETLDGVFEGMRELGRGSDWGDSVRFDPSLREQDWGHVNEPAHIDSYDSVEAERDRVGSFHYRIPGGESGADVYMRVSDFLSSLWRDFERDNFPQVLLLVGHGYLNRIFLARFFHLRPTDFECISNPKNGGIYHLRLQGDGHYRIDKMPELKKGTPKETQERIQKALRFS